MKKSVYLSRYLVSMKSLFRIIVLLFVSVLSVSSQESIGLHSDVYSGTDLMIWNPANSVNSAYHWDITLGSAHFFGFTDYATISNTSLSNLNNSARNAATIDGRSFIPENPGDQPLVIFDTDFGDKRASSNIQLSGPAVLFSVADKWKVGLFTKMRAHITAQSIPESLGIYELNDARFFDFALELEPFDLAGMFWTEIGGHFSRKINGNLSVGINVKYLLGSEGFFLNNNTSGTVDIDAESINSAGVFINTTFGFTNNSINTESFMPFETIDSGRGVGTDIGVSYSIDNWSAGVSIIDIGSVKFTQSHELYRIMSSNIDIDIANYESITTPRGLLDQITSDFSVPDPSLNNDFSIGLPTALVLQGTYQFDRELAVSGQLVQRVPLSEHSLKRENSIAITPQYSTKWISVFTPVTIYEYSKLRLGLAARFGILTIGSDHLGTLFRKHNFRGSDVYIKLSFAPIFSSDEKRASRRSRNKGVECYTF